MSVRLPSLLTRHKEGPDAPPLRLGVNAPGLPPVVSPTLSASTASSAPVSTESVAQARMAVQVEAREMLERVRVAVNTLYPDTGLASAGRALLAATDGLDARTLAVLQPVVEDYRIHAQNAIDSGAAGTGSVPKSPSPSLLSRLKDSVATTASAQLRHLATSLQNKIIAQIQRHEQTQSQNGQVHADALRGYGPLLERLTRAAGSVAQGQGLDSTMLSSADSPSLYASVLSDVHGIAGGSPVSYGTLASHVVSLHAVLYSDMKAQKDFSEKLQRDVYYLSALQTGGQSLSQAAFLSSVTTNGAHYASILVDNYKRRLRRHKPDLDTDARDTMSPVPLPSFTSPFVPTASQDGIPSDQDTAPLELSQALETIFGPGDYGQVLQGLPR